MKLSAPLYHRHPLGAHMHTGSRCVSERHKLGDAMKDAAVDPFRFEPTVFGAVRRYWALVLTVAVVITVATVGYSLRQPKVFVAQASVTVPQPVSLQSQTAAQYFDSQVLLLESQTVAKRAAGIANGVVGSDRFTVSDFSGANSTLVITPPTTATPGGYGASIISVSFKGPSARMAQVGLNAVLQAFTNARSAAIVAQAEATIADINRTIENTYGPAELGDLQTARTETIINEQEDLAHKPTVASTLQPQTPINHRWHEAAVVAFVIGIIVGAALAFGWASFRRRFNNQQDPASLYSAPKLGEIQAFRAASGLRLNRAATSDLLPVTAAPHSAAAEAFRFGAGAIERIRAEHGSRLSLVFIAPLPDAGKSLLVANLALALAEGGTRVLIIDADGGLTARFLPGASTADGLEQVLAGLRVLEECVRRDLFDYDVTVLGSGPDTGRVTGAARAKAMDFLLAEAKARYDVVLIDSPAVLKVADATELVGASDAAITVIGTDQLIRDHRELLERLELTGADIVGYIYNRAPKPPRITREDNASSPPASSPDPSPVVAAIDALPPVETESRESSPAQTLR